MIMSGLYRFLLLTGLIGSSISGAFAAECDVNLSGRFIIIQNANAPAGIIFQLQQDTKNNITGTAIDGNMTGVVTGTVGVDSRNADMMVRWNYGTVGHYTWHINKAGYMESGETADTTPGVRSTSSLSSSSSFCQ